MLRLDVLEVERGSRVVHLAAGRAVESVDSGGLNYSVD